MLSACGSGLVEETPLGAWSDVRTLRLCWNWGRRTRRTWHYDSARPWSTGRAAAGRAQAPRVSTRAPSLRNWYLGFTGSLLRLVMRGGNVAVARALGWQGALVAWARKAGCSSGTALGW